MKNLFLLCLLLTACSKTYTKPEIGMTYMDFHRLCGYGPADESNSTTTSSGTTSTIVLKTLDEEVFWGGNKGGSNRSDKGCVGRFTFVKDRLDSISSR